MSVPVNRRRFLAVSALGVAAISGCEPSGGPTADDKRQRTRRPRWTMPAEDALHAATWMSWPSSAAIWGDALPDVQDTIAAIAEVIAEFEPVKLLARSDEAARVRTLVRRSDIEVIRAQVDDLWARDTLPQFLVATGAGDAAPLAAGMIRFNGWGDKQRHAGDARLAGLVARRLRIPMISSGLVGEGGGLEVDGRGTVLAARSSWVNANRNPGLTEAQVGRRLRAVLGAKDVVWVDGLAGEDITDGHIDTLARFAPENRIVLGAPAYDDPGDPWYRVAVDTKLTLAASGEHRFATLVDPARPRGTGDQFLASYVNYYVCNDGVIAPRFGDPAADEAAAAALRRLYPKRDVVQLDIDPVAAGGGGIHCATRQQPAATRGAHTR